VLGEAVSEARPFTVKDLAGLSPWRGLVETAATWALIVAIIAVYLRVATPWALLVAVPLIASRQYALLILMHDAFHALLHPNRRLNDLIGMLVLAAPCGSTYWGARTGHLEHHRKLGDDDDPERFLHSAGPPRDKRTLASFVGHFVWLIAGGQFLYTHVTSTVAAKGVPVTRQLVAVVPRLAIVAVVHLGLLGLFVATSSWTTYVVLWVLPLATLAVVLNGLRAFCDHANLSDEPRGEAARLVSYISNPAERFFLSPFHMNYHAEHHLFPYVPHYRLPVVRQRIRTVPPPAIAATVQWRGAYLRFVCHFLVTHRRLHALRAPAASGT
jgi:fatty acid desaturase